MNEEQREAIRTQFNYVAGELKQAAEQADTWCALAQRAQGDPETAPFRRAHADKIVYECGLKLDELLNVQADEGRWHKWPDETPPIGNQYYLVTQQAPNTGMAMWIARYEFDGTWDRRHITHWRPLPEPPND